MDDAEDIDIISMLIDPHPSIAFFTNNIDYLHGYEEHHVINQQMFTQVWRCRIPTLSLRQFTAYFERLIRVLQKLLKKIVELFIFPIIYYVLLTSMLITVGLLQTSKNDAMCLIQTFLQSGYSGAG